MTMAVGKRYTLASQGMSEVGVHQMKRDGRWLVRVPSKLKGYTGRLSVSSLSVHDTKEEAIEAYEKYMQDQQNA
jgi:hypothetical protein